MSAAVKQKPVTVGKFTAHFDGMGWPRDCDFLDEVNHRLRYGEPSKSDLLVAADVMSAYRALITDTSRKRAEVVRVLKSVARAAPNIPLLDRASIEEALERGAKDAEAVRKAMDVGGFRP